MVLVMVRGAFLVLALVCAACGSGGLKKGTGGVGGNTMDGAALDAAMASAGIDAASAAIDAAAGALGNGGLTGGGSGTGSITGGISSSGSVGARTGGSQMGTAGTGGTTSVTGGANFARFTVSSPPDLDLGTLAPNVPAKQSFTVTALAALTDLKVWASGGDISLDAPTTTCTANLAEGASCTVAFTFVAATLGWKHDLVGIRAGGDYGQVVNIAVTATISKANELAIAPKTPQAYACSYGKTSPAVAFTVTNIAGTNSGTITAALVGDDARDFAIAESDCTTLAPQATCKVQVVCRPTLSASADTRHAVLSVTDGQTLLAVPLNAEVTF